MICHIEVLSGLFGYFGTGFLEVIFYLVFEQILQSRDISNLVWLDFWGQELYRLFFVFGCRFLPWSSWLGCYCKFIVTGLLTSADLWQSVVAGYKFSVVINLRNLLKICSYFGCENKKYSGINNIISHILYIPQFWRKYLPLLTNFWALYLSEFLTDWGQILDSNSYDQAQQTLWYHTTPRP